MNRLRIGFAVTILLGTMYGFAGLLDSLQHFSAGLIVAALGFIGIGAVDYVETRHDNRLFEERLAVWERRDR